MTIMLLGVGDGSHKPQLELVALWELPQLQLLGFFFPLFPKNAHLGWMRADLPPKPTSGVDAC